MGSPLVGLLPSLHWGMETIKLPQWQVMPRLTSLSGDLDVYCQQNIGRYVQFLIG